MRKENINPDKMNRIGVITVSPERLHRDDYLVITRDDESPTHSFFTRMQQCSYKNGEDCILSMYDDENLILAHFDNNAIFLLSQNPVLSPRQFVNSMINLQNCSNEMSRLIERSSRYGYSEFGLVNLNINFVEIELSTGIPSDVAEKYILSYNQNFSTDCSTQNGPRVGISYNTGLGSISHKHTSQYGTNLLGFLNEMIKINPDIRLLMSNVICRNSPLDLRKTMMDAIGDPDNGGRAINYALNNMLMAARMENDSYMASPRVLPEVKKYMRSLDEKAYDINTKLKEKSKTSRRENRI